MICDKLCGIRDSDFYSEFRAPLNMYDLERDKHDLVLEHVGPGWKTCTTSDKTITTHTRPGMTWLDRIRFDLGDNVTSAGPAKKTMYERKTNH